jgi:hypothetical protein
VVSAEAERSRGGKLTVVERHVVELNCIVSKSLTKLCNGAVESLTVYPRRKDDVSLLGRNVGVERVSRAANDLQLDLVKLSKNLCKHLAHLGRIHVAAKVGGTVNSSWTTFS